MGLSLWWGNDVALAVFILLAVIAIVCALSVVAQRNALFSALSLVGVFAATAMIYLMLSAPFLAVLQILVYAGAIMVLFVFVIMLLSVTYAESGEAAGIPSGFKRILALVLGVVLAAQFVILGTGFVLTGTPGDAGADIGSVRAVGLALYKQYMFPFEVASVLLLVAIVGAVAITRRHGRGLEGHLREEEAE
jgi:NADH-quinone oxidoreductase subunit J